MTTLAEQKREAAAFDEAKFNAFLGRVIGDFGAALSLNLNYIGVKLGLYKALGKHGPATSAELAKKTKLKERYIREWLLNQAAGGYIEYDQSTGRYHLPQEHAGPLTDDKHPMYVAGGFFVIKAMSRAVEQIEKSFKTGGGILWGDHDPDLFIGTERFFRPGYVAHLVDAWIPALAGVEAKLKKGAVVADVGCGHGASTILMAQAFGKSKFYGFDNHKSSVKTATARAKEAKVSKNARFVASDAKHIPNHSYDVITFFDCFHDMGDPLGAAKRAYQVLKDDGTVMMVEPMAGHTVEANFNAIGRTFSAASTLCCTANSLALKGPGLGAVASDRALSAMFHKAGFKHFRRAAETPFNRIFEIKK